MRKPGQGVTAFGGERFGLYVPFGQRSSLAAVWRHALRRLRRQLNACRGYQLDQLIVCHAHSDAQVAVGCDLAQLGHGVIPVAARVHALHCACRSSGCLLGLEPGKTFPEAGELLR